MQRPYVYPRERKRYVNLTRLVARRREGTTWVWGDLSCIARVNTATEWPESKPEANTVNE